MINESESGVDQFKRLERLYHAALELTAAERPAFLNQACAGDEALRREVEALLTAQPQAGAFLAAPAIEYEARRRAAQLVQLTPGDDQSAAPALSLIGRSINQYEIVAPLGRGGMGEVWLAEDTRLHRKVALKLLPAQFTHDAARVRRFEQEARAVSALNHPHIVTLFDLGQCADDYFMATEFVDGRTLRAHLRERERLPVNEALAIVTQVAEALGATHAAGIVHRDIKPENVMLRHDGYVKVLDFGLAKIGENLALQDAAGETQSSITEAGAVLGTVSYMSPEQARALRIDARTDIFSLGIVFYELLTGRLPFEGTTAGEMFASILRSEPLPLGASAPEALQRVVLKALAKERDARYQTVAEFAGELKTLAQELEFQARLADSENKTRLSGGSASAASAPSTSSLSSVTGARRAVWKYLLGAAAALFAVVAGWQLLIRPGGNFESEVLPGLKNTPVDGWKTGPEFNRLLIGIAPDGHTIAFSKGEHGQTDIFVKQLNGGEPHNVTNDEWTDYSPIWSPNGQQLAYVSTRNGRNEIWLIPSLGGPGQMVKTLDGTPRWLTRWSRDGRRIFYEIQRNLFALELSSGQVTRLTTFDNEASDKDYFALSADELWLAYSQSVDGAQQIWARPLAGGAPIQVTHEGEENLYPVWLPDGERVVYSSKRNGIHQICVAWLKGRKPVQLTFGPENLTPWDVSADGRRIFYVSSKDEANLFLHDLASGTERQISANLLLNLFPNFAPDGQAIAFQQVDQGVNFSSGALLAIELSGAGKTTRLVVNGFDPRWSPTGERVAFLRHSGKSFSLWTVRRDGADERQLVESNVVPGSFTQQTYNWTQPQQFSWSPDGRQLAYCVRQSKLMNVVVSPAEGGLPVMLSQNTDAEVSLSSPVFSPDGKQLAYLAQRSGEGQRQCQVWAAAAGSNRMIFQAAGYVRMLGWSVTGREFYIGATEQTRFAAPLEMKLLRLSLERDKPQTVTQFSNVYFSSLALSPDAKQLVFVSRQSGTDEVWQIALADGKRKRVSANVDPNVFLSGLTWSPQQNQLCFTKQSNTTSIWMIEHFK